MKDMDEAVSTNLKKVVSSWIQANDEEEEDKPFVPVITWPEGTEYISEGPFFE